MLYMLASALSLVCWTCYLLLLGQSYSNAYAMLTGCRCPTLTEYAGQTRPLPLLLCLAWKAVLLCQQVLHASLLKIHVMRACALCV